MPYYERFRLKFISFHWELVACLFLILLTLAVYGQVRHFEFINLDDPMYLTDNPYVKKGLNCRSIFWAFTAFSVGNWHPLTWLSHMLDVDLYGMNSGAHHLTNLQFHIANTLALFFVFKLMTGALWRSAAVAALFALHPLHVESVAWVAERKDVLSTLFWMLTMLLYIWYVRGPMTLKYLGVLLSYGLGLMSKPMLVTVPIILLLLDYWPLGRFQSRPIFDNKITGPKKTFIFLIYEKIPFFILSAVSSAVTLIAQQAGGAISSLGAIPFSVRIANALVSYAAYIGKLIWPSKLAVIYPYSHNLPLWQVTGACLIITFVSLMVFRIRHRQPSLIFGWSWYLVTLIPVIGLVQVGLQSMADRYTYVPLIGLFVMIAWGAPALLPKRLQKTILATAGILLLPVLMTATWIQASYWKDSAMLFKRTLMVTEGNFLAHNNLGVALERQGKIEEAVRHYTETLKINPNFAKAYVNLGHLLSKEGKIDEAVSYSLKAIQIDPQNAPARSLLGLVLESQGKLDEAVRYYVEALRIDPDYSQVHINLGNILHGQGKTEEAMAHYIKALQIEPNKEANYNLGALLFRQGRTHEAIAHYREALRIDPLFAKAYNNLGAALAKNGQANEAVLHFREALRIDPDHHDARSNLKKMLEAQGKTNETLSRLQQIIAQNPQDAVAHYELGHVYKSLGELNLAEAYYQQAISIAPSFFDALKNLAVVHAMQGKYDSAREYLERCIALQPDQWETYYLIAGTYARQKRTEESVQWLKQAVAKGFKNWKLLKADQNLEGIRHTPYYRSLIDS